jgi:hypothetical protein
MKNYINYVDYESESSNAGCDCGGVCRCSIITKVKINGLYPKIFKHLGLNEPTSKIGKYCFDKIFSGREFSFANLFDWEASKSYYGEEVTSITCHDEEKLYGILKNFSECSELEMTKAALRAEYGFILPEIDPLKTVEISKLAKTDISPKPKKNTRNDCFLYSAPEKYPGFICGIVIDNNDGTYRLIDGHNRFERWLPLNVKKDKVDFIILR